MFPRPSQEQRQSASHGDTGLDEQDSGLHARMRRVRRGHAARDFSVRHCEGGGNDHGRMADIPGSMGTALFGNQARGRQLLDEGKEEDHCG